MVRRLLTLLLAFPLLLPPGICVCEIASGRAAAPACPVNGCACCQHDAPAADPGPVHVTGGRPARDNGPAHLPGCPACENGAQWKCRTSPPDVAAPLPGAAPAPLKAALSAAAVACPIASVCAAARPIYLTTLPLRI